MSAGRTLRAYLLLLAFASGSVVLPAAHQLRHAEHTSTHDALAAEQPGHIHGDAVGFSIALDGLADFELVCVLCKVVSSWVLLLRGEEGRAGLGASVVLRAAAGYAASPHRLHFSRGPPVAV